MNPMEENVATRTVLTGVGTHGPALLPSEGGEDLPRMGQGLPA